MAHKVMQAELHDPDNDKIGDCLRACLASVLDLELREVPHIARALWPSDDDDAWNAATNEFLATRGLYFVPLGVGYRHLLRGYCLAVGPSPRYPEVHHVVVYKDGEFWHDPHPEGGDIMPVFYKVIVSLCDG